METSPINQSLQSPSLQISSPKGKQRLQVSSSQIQNRQLSMICVQFQQQYKQSLHKLSGETRQKIQKWTCNREKQNYFYFIEPQKFVSFSKQERIQHFLQRNSQDMVILLLEAMKKRQDRVEEDIFKNIVQIAACNKQNNKSHNLLASQLPIQQQNSQQIKAAQEELRRRHQQIIRQERKQRQRLQRLKQKQILEKKQQQQQKLSQQQKSQEQMRKHNSQILTKKILQSKQRRQLQQKLLLQRNSDYKFILKSSTANQLLHEKLQKQFRQKYEEQLLQDRKQAKTERSRLQWDSRVEEMNIQEHQGNYLRWKAQNEAARVTKLQEQNRLIELYQNQLKKYSKFKRQIIKDNSDQQASQSQQNPYSRDPQRGNSYHRARQQQRKVALQKRRKMQTYWQTFVKHEKQPTIDLKKQQQLQKLIQSLQNSHKLRKIRNQKGQYVYQQIKPSDPAMKGLEYLQYSRQVGRMRKSLKPKQTREPSTNEQKTQRPTDYLKQLRESRSQSLRQSGQKSKWGFLQKREMSFQQKLQRVQKETFRLEKRAKLSENQLKYGKFKTSEEILQCKEEIDNSRVQMLRVKLMLAAKGGL